MQATMSRLGAKMPFEQAVEEMWWNHHTQVEESTLRRVTYRHGQAAEEMERQEVERLEETAPEAEATPDQLVISVDGAFIALTNGDWREVKSIAVGEFESSWQEKKGQLQVKTRDISYFSRSYRIREFERYALAELHRRGLPNARKVVSVNDGSEWIQSFAAYHFPQAVQILDFSHALEHLADAGKAILGEGTDPFKRWFERIAHQLKHKPPARTLADLALLQAKAETEEQAALILATSFYLSKRRQMIDYPHFRANGYPIGSGSVESGHKVVVHARLKQAGMRWAEEHVDSMLALRNHICNRRWSAGWSQIVSHHWQQRRLALKQKARRQRPSPPPITLASVEVAPLPPETVPPSDKDKQPFRPAPDHPWRKPFLPARRH